MAKNSEHRVILSTNEFHRARQHPSSYVLRLIYVQVTTGLKQRSLGHRYSEPRTDIASRRKIVLGVRSGILPFVVHLG